MTRLDGRRAKAVDVRSAGQLLRPEAGKVGSAAEYMNERGVAGFLRWSSGSSADIGKQAPNTGSSNVTWAPTEDRPDTPNGAGARSAGKLANACGGVLSGRQEGYNKR